MSPSYIKELLLGCIADCSYFCLFICLSDCLYIYYLMSACLLVCILSHWQFVPVDSCILWNKTEKPLFVCVRPKKATQILNPVKISRWTFQVLSHSQPSLDRIVRTNLSQSSKSYTAPSGKKIIYNKLFMYLHFKWNFIVNTTEIS